MQIYSIIMFAIAVILIVISFLIYRGNTAFLPKDLRLKGRNLNNYTKDLGRALFGVALAPYLSGVIALFGESDTVMILAGFALIGLLVYGISRVRAVQRKYNLRKF